VVTGDGEHAISKLAAKGMERILKDERTADSDVMFHPMTCVCTAAWPAGPSLPHLQS